VLGAGGGGVALVSLGVSYSTAQHPDTSTITRQTPTPHNTHTHTHLLLVLRPHQALQELLVVLRPAANRQLPHLHAGVTHLQLVMVVSVAVTSLTTNIGPDYILFALPFGKTKGLVLCPGW
jgi:hypothetical protein